MVSPGRHRVSCTLNGVGFTQDFDIPAGTSLVIVIKAGVFGGVKIETLSFE